MFLKKSILFFFVLLTSLVYSQGEANIWYFGQNAGLDFNSGAPVALTNGQLDSYEGTSVLSNALGELMFYTNGVSVYNKNHEVMPNGTGLYGDISSTQSSLILQKPNSPNLYYLFTVDDEAGVNGFCYSVIDLGLQSGFGDVTSEKNVAIYNPTCEKLTAVKHANNLDYWIITHGWNSSIYYCYLLTENGLSPTPIQNIIGLNLGYNVLYWNQDAIGAIKMSPDGSKLASCNPRHRKIELFDFDNATGIISNETVIYNDESFNSGLYGLEFSIDSNILYATNNGRILQFNLTTNPINTSLFMVNENDFSSFTTSLQLGPDSKIYVALLNTTKIGVINNPHVAGVGCSFQNNAIDLNGRVCKSGLPNFCQSYFTTNIQFQNSCFGETTQFSFNNSSITSATWNFGDGATSNLLSPSHMYATTGIYDVSVTVTSPQGTATSTKQIIISQVPTIANTITNQIVCGTANMNYDLAQFNATLLGSQSTTTFGVAYFTSQANAENHSNPLPNVQSLPLGTTTFFAKVYNLANVKCNAITSFQVSLYEQPIANTVADYVICENLPYDGTENFNLTSKNTEVLGSQSTTTFSVSYHQSLLDAQNNTNVLPLSYTNTNTTETIFVRIQNNAEPSCYATTSFTLKVIQQPQLITVSDYVLCDDASNNGTELFDLASKTTEVLNGQSASVFQVSYFPSLPDAQNNTNAITIPYTNTSNNQTIYYSIMAVGNPNCNVISNFKLVVSTVPVANTPNAIFNCDDAFNDGMETFSLSQNNTAVLGTQNSSQFTVSYHLNPTDATANANALPLNYSNISNPQTIFARIQNNANPLCFATTSFQIGLHQMPTAHQPQNLYTCDVGDDGIEIFDLTSQNATVLGNQNSNSFTISYHNSLQDAQNDVQPLPANYSSSQPTKTIFVRIENNASSSCYSTTSFQLIIYQNPVLNLNANYSICEGVPITIQAPTGFSSYQWSTGATTHQTTITQAGQYSVTVSQNHGTISCTTTKNITVVNSNVATINQVITTDFTDTQNSISIVATGDGIYEYSIDGVHYQDEPTFTNLESGIYTIYVKDKRGCGIEDEQVYLLAYPKFFSPNGDGANDYWKIKFSNKEPFIKTQIFDRYGKLIFTMNNNLQAWDGTFNGVSLPATDYWFVVIREDGRQFKGHFSLMR